MPPSSYTGISLASKADCVDALDCAYRRASADRRPTCACCGEPKLVGLNATADLRSALKRAAADGDDAADDAARLRGLEADADDRRVDLCFDCGAKHMACLNVALGSSAQTALKDTRALLACKIGVSPRAAT